MSRVHRDLVTLIIRMAVAAVVVVAEAMAAVVEEEEGAMVEVTDIKNEKNALLYEV